MTMNKKLFSFFLVLLIGTGIVIYYRHQIQNENYADAALQSGFLNLKNKKSLQAMGDFSFLADRYGNSHNKTIQKIVAKALLKKAEILTELHDINEAIVTYEQLSDLYMNSHSKRLRYEVAEARFNQGTLLLQQKRYEEAMVAFSYLVSTYGSDPSLKIKRMIAQVMTNETIILNATGHPDTALNIHSSIVEKFYRETDPQLRLIAAQSIMARTKNRLDQQQWGLALYNSNAFIKLYQDSTDPVIKKFLLKNLLYRAEILHRVKRIPESEKEYFGHDPQEAALKTYDEILDKIASAPQTDADYPYYKVIALLGKTQILSKKQNTSEALALCDQIYKDFFSSSNPKIQQIVAETLLSKATILISLNNDIQASAIYDQILNRYKPNTDPAQNTLNKTIIKAYIDKSVLLKKHGKNENALQYLSTVINLYKNTKIEKLYYEISNAYLAKAELETTLKQYDQALATYTGFIAVAHHKTDPMTRYNGAQAIIEKAKLLIFLHKGREIAQTYDQLTNFYIDDTDPEMRQLIAKGMYERSQSLFQNNRGYTALEINQDIFLYFEKDKKDPVIADVLTKTQALNKQLDLTINW